MRYDLKLFITGVVALIGIVFGWIAVNETSDTAQFICTAIALPCIPLTIGFLFDD